MASQRTHKDKFTMMTEKKLPEYWYTLNFETVRKYINEEFGYMITNEKSYVGYDGKIKAVDNVNEFSLTYGIPQYIKPELFDFLISKNQIITNQIINMIPTPGFSNAYMDLQMHHTDSMKDAFEEDDYFVDNDAKGTIMKLPEITPKQDTVAQDKLTLTENQLKHLASRSQETRNTLNLLFPRLIKKGISFLNASIWKNTLNVECLMKYNLPVINYNTTGSMSDISLELDPNYNWFIECDDTGKKCLVPYEKDETK